VSELTIFCWQPLALHFGGAFWNFRPVKRWPLLTKISVCALQSLRARAPPSGVWIPPEPVAAVGVV
jgi:hypothetical protein